MKILLTSADTKLLEGAVTKICELGKTVGDVIVAIPLKTEFHAGGFLSKRLLSTPGSKDLIKELQKMTVSNGVNISIKS
jgi:ribosomal protein S10